MTSAAVADMKARSSPSAAPGNSNPINHVLDLNRVHDLDTEVKALVLRVKDATAHASETMRQAESQHMSHPSLYQRAHGATFANEPAGVHHLHWEHRSLVRNRQHKDEVAVEKLKAAYSELVVKSLDLRGQVVPQDKPMVKEVNAVEDAIGKVRLDLEALQEIVTAR